MAKFEECFNTVMKLEGGYVLHNVPGDRGGMTYAGIARNSWPNWEGWRFIDNKTDVPLSMVENFYRENFWNVIKGDKINSQAIAFIIYDFAVNAGCKSSVRIAQLICKTTSDGVMGPKTLAVLNQMSDDFIMMFSMLKIIRYKDICMRDKVQLKFLCGWINRVQKGLEIYGYSIPGHTDTKAT
jgi:lysozyme family protein